MNAKLAWNILKGTVQEFSEDAVPRLAAALAYYAMFSIGPLLVIVIAVAALFFRREAISGEVAAQLQSLLGETAAQTVQTMLAHQSHESSVWATIVGGTVLIIGATGVFGQLQDALNTIWEVKPKPGQGVWGFVRNRFLSFTMVLGIAFLLLISMVISAGLQAFGHVIDQVLPMSEWVAQALHLGISLGVVTLLFAMVFKVLPDAKVRWRDVWVGAIGTSLLFTVGKFLIGLYLGRESVSSTYGAAGSAAIILLWVYYSSLILFFGAEFTQVYAKQTGSRIAPSANAVPVTERSRVQEGIPHTDTEPSHQPSPAFAQSGAHDPSFPNGRVQARQPISVMAAVGVAFVGGWLAHRKLSGRQ
ncbi:MAG: YihY/virulence factor BrkB family protein [Verrucomicrobiota bacterium]